VRTTDSIIADLNKRAEQGENVTQQVIAHETLARLRAERAEAVKRKDSQRVRDLDTQIVQWLGMVDEDVDDRIAEQPKKDSVKTVDGLAEPKA
jgi:hypothetical protein